ncbi:MAG TPA: hypothetical protein VFX21_05865 [Acidimicrobiia bacterium]|nr:hypothetical protein [Acidimicrobiia bacterium]
MQLTDSKESPGTGRNLAAIGVFAVIVAVILLFVRAAGRRSASPAG